MSAMPAMPAKPPMPAMLTLYKTSRGRVNYWEAWKRDTKLWVHTGLLGHYGRITKQPMKGRETEAAAVKRYAALARADGYAPIPDDDLRDLVVQYPNALAGAADPMDIREEFYALLNERLGWIGNGTCLGGDAETTVMNMRCRVVDPALATKPLVADLRKTKKITGVVIAARVGRSGSVLWPAAGGTKFSLRR